MAKGDLKQTRQLMNQGFYYDNLDQMARCCRDDGEPENLVSAYVLASVFSDLANEMGDQPMIVSEVRKIEAKYRTAINLCLETAVSGASLEERIKRLRQLIEIHWESKTE
jgi:hypothetical protein